MGTVHPEGVPVVTTQLTSEHEVGTVHPERVPVVHVERFPPPSSNISATITTTTTNTSSSQVMITSSEADLLQITTAGGDQREIRGSSSDSLRASPSDVAGGFTESDSQLSAGQIHVDSSESLPSPALQLEEDADSEQMEHDVEEEGGNGDGDSAGMDEEEEEEEGGEGEERMEEEGEGFVGGAMSQEEATMELADTTQVEGMCVSVLYDGTPYAVCDCLCDTHFSLQYDVIV